MLSHRFQLPAGTRYQWWDWSHLLLITYGIMMIGFLLIVFYGGRFGLRFILRLINRKAVLQTAIE